MVQSTRVLIMGAICLLSLSATAKSPVPNKYDFTKSSNACSKLSRKLAIDYRKLQQEWNNVNKLQWEIVQKKSPGDLKDTRNKLSRVSKQKWCVQNGESELSHRDRNSLWRRDLQKWEVAQDKIEHCRRGHKYAASQCLSTCEMTPADCEKELKDYGAFLLKLKQPLGRK